MTAVPIDAARYAAELHTATRTYATYVARLRALTAALAERPQLAREVEWRTHVVIALTALRNAGEQLVPDGAVPPSFESVVECLSGVEAETESLAAEFVGQASTRGADGLAAGQLGRIAAYLRRASSQLVALPYGALDTPGTADTRAEHSPAAEDVTR